MFMKKVRSFLRKCMRWILLHFIWTPLYRIGSLRKVDPKLVLFATEFDKEPGDNFIPLMDKLTAEGYTCLFFSVTQAMSRAQRQRRSFRFMWIYSHARVLFLMDTFAPTSSCKPRKGTEVVQLWHGCGAFKQFGYSTLSLAWGVTRRQVRFLPIHRNYTCIPISSPNIIPALTEAFNCSPEILKPWGVPRTDYFFQPDAVAESRRRVLEAFPEIGERKIVLYAPTFRGDQVRMAHHDNVLDYTELTKALDSKCVLILKAHPRAKESIPAPALGQEPFVFDGAQLPIESLLCAADLLISDYSSLIFEYSLLGRPMLFYPYDLEDYDSARSFYSPYLKFVPGDLVWSTEDIIAAIRRNLFEGGFDPARIEAFCRENMSSCDGHSTERILHNLFGL